MCIKMLTEIKKNSGILVECECYRRDHFCNNCTFRQEWMIMCPHFESSCCKFSFNEEFLFKMIQNRQDNHYQWHKNPLMNH